MNKNKNSILSEYQKLQKIGEGLTSTVYKGIHSETDLVCLKVISKQFYSRPIGKQLIDNQIIILKQINHINLLKIRNHHQSQQQNIIVTDFCEGGNLFQLTRKCIKFTEEQTLMIVQGIINGLQYLFNKKIVHRDLKPENIFFKKGEPVVADFGFAVHLDNKALNKVNAGSPLYMSPQTLESHDFSLQSDVFAIGVIIYQMLKGKTPWAAVSEKQLLNKIKTIKPVLQLKNKKFQAIILKCLQPKKQIRLKFPEIKTFFNEWKNQRFQKICLLSEVKNIKKTKDQQKEKRPTKTHKLNLNKKSQKQNVLNQFNCQSKTHQLSVQPKSRYRNRSIMVNQAGIKTKRNKSQKFDNNFCQILGRLDPQKMKFLPSSMIQKFKFILKCYERIIDKKQNPKSHNINQKDVPKSHNINININENDKPKSYTVNKKDIASSTQVNEIKPPLKSLQIDQNSVPKSLQYDKITADISRCKDQRQFCQSISAYIGRMYRLSKNYKIYQEFTTDLQVLYQRVESFC